MQQLLKETRRRLRLLSGLFGDEPEKGRSGVGSSLMPDRPGCILATQTKGCIAAWIQPQADSDQNFSTLVGFRIQPASPFLIL